LKLVESTDKEPEDMEDWLCISQNSMCMTSFFHNSHFLSLSFWGVLDS
jgi:hypothetical protein